MIADVLTDSVTFYRKATAARDEIGGETPATETSITVACYAEPYTSVAQRGEAQPDRNTQLGQWLVVVAANTDVTGFDRAVLHDRDMEIVAPPAPFRHARTGAEHHQELRLLEIS